MRRAMNWIAAIVSLGMANLALVNHLAAQTAPSTPASAPRIEDYATIESMVGGVPVFSFGNLVYVYGQSPDLLPGSVMQRGNTNSVVKIRPKKSWEIKHNLAGSEHEMTVRSAWTDSHPTLPIHLIDGDPETVWSSWGCAVPDGRPEWIRIDLPLEAEVASVVLVCAKNSRALPASWKSTAQADRGEAQPGWGPVGDRLRQQVLERRSVREDGTQVRAAAGQTDLGGGEKLPPAGEFSGAHLFLGRIGGP